MTAGVMTGMLLAALEATVVGTAMPTIVAALGGLAHYSWVVSAYLLTSTVTVPLWGKLSDVFGRRILYQAGVAVFLIGSVLCGFATSMTWLILARALQGAGAGALVPLAMTIIGDIYTLAERARMQGLFSGIWGLASIVGPIVGGFITDQLSWRWVFYINVPFGIASAVIIGLALRGERKLDRAPIDYLGAAVLTGACTILMLALAEGGSLDDITRPRNLVLYAVVAALFVWFVRIEKRAADPVVPLTLFRNRVVSVSVIVGLLAGVGMFGAITFVPLFAQGVLGVSATAAGSMLMPLMLSWVTASVIGGRLLIRVGYRPLVLGGLTAMVAGFALMSFFTREMPRIILIAELALIGTGLGFTMLTLLIAAQHSVPREQLGITTSLNQFSRSIGGALGVALLGALMSAGLGANLHRTALQPHAPMSVEEADRIADDPNVLVSPEAATTVSPAALEASRGALGASLRFVFAAGGVMSLLALFFGFAMPKGRPESQHATRDAESDGEQFVMAEMTTLDAENEPCCH
ncbi:MAG TPA: MDR family MFS transporter [Thermoanaerobaculia bacterium]|nr:MDR family MFS transporter [Thermoanaerobaculia bacterium]